MASNPLITAGAILNPNLGIPILEQRRMERKALEQQAGQDDARKRDLKITLATELAKQGDIPSTEFLRAEGLLAEGSEFPQSEAGLNLSSPEGKQFQDLQSVIEQYGPGSIQAVAFNDMLNKKDDAADLKTEGGMRREFTNLSKQFIDVQTAFRKVQKAADSPSAAGDIALIFGFMKMLDPGSTVREGEFATAATAGSVPERIWGAYNRIVSGERLTGSQRADFIDQAFDAFDSERIEQFSREKMFSGLAERAQVNPENVAIDFVGDLRESAGNVTAESVADEFKVPVDDVLDTMALHGLSVREVRQQLIERLRGSGNRS